MNDKLTKNQLAAILVAMDKAITEGPWTASRFLTLIGQKLQNIRSQFEQQLDNVDDENHGRTAALAQQRTDKRASMKKIFVALYAFDGSNLESWERIIAHLPNQIISRPVYSHEEDVIANIRSKSNTLNEAYVAIYVDPNFILPQIAEKIAMDKLGKPLMALKDKAIQLDNIDVFVHQTLVYRYVSGRLIKK